MGEKHLTKPPARIDLDLCVGNSAGTLVPYPLYVNSPTVVDQDLAGAHPMIARRSN
jgi:hypothetical protein